MIAIQHLSLSVRLAAAVALASIASSYLFAQDQATEDTDVSAAVEAGTLGAVIPIHTEITDITADSVKRRIDVALERGAETIIFDLDTPGGLVTSTFDITDYIRNLDVKTVAWINPTAHSGGAIVAISCNEIVMARSSRIGDAQVIFGNPLGAEAVPEDLKAKVTTPVLAEVRASAQLRGYDQVLCEAFIEPDREVWWMENTETGERDFVFREEKLKRLGEVDDTASSEGDEESDEDSDENGSKPTKKKTDDKKTAKKTATTDAPSEASHWKLVEKYHDIVLDVDVDVLQPVVRTDQLLQMSAVEAHAYGFSQGIVRDESMLKERYGLSRIIRLDAQWSENLALWMTSMWVRGFLMIIIMLGAYVEFHTPGVGVPGLTALIALAIFVGAPYLAGLANIWEILFILTGVVLMALEIFVIPGFGVAGISGILLVIIGLLFTFVPDEPGRSLPLYLPSLPSSVAYLKAAMKTMAWATLASILGMIMLGRYLPRMPIFRRIVPANPTPSEVKVDDEYRGLARVGDVGEARGPLHPAGKALFGSDLVDVVTQGEYLETGVDLEVIERRGNRVVVRARKA